MVMRTIRCRLRASRETRQYLWETMVPYTCLINQLFAEVAQSDQFEAWQHKGEIPRDALKTLIATIEERDGSYGLPERVSSSAIRMTQYVYKSWFALRKRRYWQIKGKRQWLEAIEQDSLLAQQADDSLESICAKADELLAHFTQDATTSKRKTKSKKQSSPKTSSKGQSLMGKMLDLFDETRDRLTQRAIIHLLKNDLTVNRDGDDEAALKLKLASKQIEIQRLEEQMQSQFPKGRDPTGERFAQNLMEAIALPLCGSSDDLDLHFAEWLNQTQIQFLNSLPYPILWVGQDEFKWTTRLREQPASGQVNTEPAKTSPCPDNQTPTPSSHQKRSKKKRRRKRKQICSNEVIHLEFKRLKNHLFRIECDRNQLPLFKQFLSDYQSYMALPSEQRFSQKLFALRSAQLLWREDPAKLKEHKRLGAQSPLMPWDIHRLYLHCTYDSQYLTAEGTEEAIAAAKPKLIKGLKEYAPLSPEETDALDLPKKQKGAIKRQQTTLRLLDNSPPPRPKRETYQGDPLITVGVSLSRRMPLTACVMQISTQTTLDIQTTKQLLLIEPKTKLETTTLSNTKQKPLTPHRRKYAHWRLVTKLHAQQKQNVARRQKEQQQDGYRDSHQESNLADYVERLLANRLVKLAIKWQAGSIVVPDAKNIREVVESRIQAEAQAKFPDEVELQKQYRQEIRASYHRWSYARLRQYICDRAALFNIPVLMGKQEVHLSLPESAAKIAIAAHQQPSL